MGPKGTGLRGPKAPSATGAGARGRGRRPGRRTHPTATGLSRTSYALPAWLRPCLEARGTWPVAAQMERQPPGTAPGGMSRGSSRALRPSPSHEPSQSPGQPSQATLKRALPGPATPARRPSPLSQVHCGPSPQPRRAMRPGAREPAPCRPRRPPHSR